MARRTLGLIALAVVGALLIPPRIDIAPPGSIVGARAATIRLPHRWPAANWWALPGLPAAAAAWDFRAPDYTTDRTGNGVTLSTRESGASPVEVHTVGVGLELSNRLLRAAAPVTGYPLTILVVARDVAGVASGGASLSVGPVNGWALAQRTRPTGAASGAISGTTAGYVPLDAAAGAGAVRSVAFVAPSFDRATWRTYVDGVDGGARLSGAAVTITSPLAHVAVGGLYRPASTTSYYPSPRYVAAAAWGSALSAADVAAVHAGLGL